MADDVFVFLEMNLQQYLQYLPVPTIDTELCNSSKHYNGHIDNDKICAGFTDAEKTPCYVSIFCKLLQIRLWLRLT